MKINRVYIKNFGGISNKEYILSNGLNVIFGQNESGKSTFLAFIRFMFYGAKKSRGKELSFRDKYMPWSGEDMCGEIEFSINGSKYSLSRSVSASGRKKDVNLINKTTGDTVDSFNLEEIGTDLFGMSEQAFLKTMFIGSEGTKIDSDGEILTKISNVSQSGDESVSYQAICDEINNQIADLSSSRRSKAIIPLLEKKLDSAKEQLSNAKEVYAHKNSLTEEAEHTGKLLDKATNEKSEILKLLSKANQYADSISFEKSKIKLKDAEDAYNSILKSDYSESDKYKVFSSISKDEENILLTDNSEQIATSKIHEVLLKDKLKSSKTSATICLFASIITMILGFIFPISFAGTGAFILIYTYLLLSSKKIEKELSEISSKITELEKSKNDILNKYSIENVERYKTLKREFEDESARAELIKSKLKIAKSIYDERTAEHNALCEKLKSRYGSLDNLDCDEITIDEAKINERLNIIDNDILHFTAEYAKIKSGLESVNDVSQEIANLERTISDSEDELTEANKKLSVLNLAAEILDSAYEEMKSNFAPKLAKSTIEIFKSLTGNKYGELIVNDAFQIRVKSDGKYEDSNFLSSGTIQQLYFSLRLGIIELTMSNSPLFIDDAFITYDDERFKRASEFLENYSRNNQVIFCTCHQRERNMPDAEVLKF